MRRHLSLALIWGIFAIGARAQDFDLVIRHARLVDGTGAPSIDGDIAVRGNLIAAVGKFAGTGRTEIDAASRVVSPGFIDVHTHCEDICELPMAENFLRMGVTTVVTGNCGTSKTNIGKFFHDIERAHLAVNVATLIAQGSVRFQVMGGSFARPPTPGEVAQMRALVEQAMRDGAVGLSTGLIYLPGTFTKTAEIIDLAKIVAAHGGIYTSHMRHEDSRILEALDEVIAVAREAKVSAEVSHLKLGGPTAWGRAAEILAYLDSARAGGLAITQDVYAYTASSTGIGVNLIDAQFLEGGRERYRERLADPAIKSRMIADMKAYIARGKRGDFGYAVIASFQADPRLNGKTIPQAALLHRGSDSLGDQIETILDIEARGGAQGVFHGINETDLVKFLAQPLTMIASDGGPRKFGDGVPHPRSYGNNARVLGRYVRELKVLTLEDAVRKMTSLPAKTFKLGARGELKPGYVADLAVFDPATVNDPSTYDSPHHYAVGFSDVIVNGVPVIRAEKLTGARPGTPVKLSSSQTSGARL